MTIRHTLTAVAALGAIAFATAACTPAADDADAARETDTTTIIEREVPAAPVVVEREVQGPPIVIERDGPPTTDSTTVRAGRDGIEVETTNR